MRVRGYRKVASNTYRRPLLTSTEPLASHSFIIYFFLEVESNFFNGSKFVANNLKRSFAEAFRDCLWSCWKWKQGKAKEKGKTENRKWKMEVANLPCYSET